MNYVFDFSKVQDKDGKISGQKAKKLSDSDRDHIIAITGFLPGDTGISERLYAVYTGLTSRPLCPVCGNFTKYKGSGRYFGHCSSKCSNSSNDVKAKKVESCMTIYGVSNPSKARVVLDKIRSTSMERYGVTNPSKSDRARAAISEATRKLFDSPDRYSALLAKRSETCMTRYGVTSFSKTGEFKEKTMQTNMDRYGVPWRARTDEWKENAKATFIRLYGVDNPFKSEEVKAKIASVNLLKYGVTNPSMAPEVKAKRDTTSLIRYGGHYASRHISVESKAILADKDALLDLCKSVPNAHDHLGITNGTLHSHLDRHGVKHLVVKSHESAMEVFISQAIESNGHSVIKRSRTVIPPLELDMIIPELNLAIEYNGSFWHSQARGKGPGYHIGKTQGCAAKGIQLLHIFDFEFKKYATPIMNYLMARLHIESTDADASVVIEEIPSGTDSSEFLNEYCMSDITVATYALQMKSGDDILAQLYLVKSRNAAFDWEILACPTVSHHQYAFNMLVAYFVNITQPDSLVLYVDNCLPPLYDPECAGLTLTQNIPPMQIRTSGFSEFVKPLPWDWASEQTAVECDIVWDCGHKEYSWKKTN